MEIKPVGYERDKQITHARRGTTMDERWRPEPYSTDIAYAHALWGDMKRAGSGPVMITMPIDGPKGFKILCWFVSDDPSWKNVFLGVDEADAISGAWLKWNEERRK